MVKANEDNDLKYRQGLSNDAGRHIQHPIKKTINVVYDEKGNPVSVIEKKSDDLEYFTE